MNNKLYVGNISFQLEESELELAFSQNGTVKSIKIITDFETGRSKGFGFVEMENDEQAQTCIENLDGQDLGGRTLRVSVARERSQDSRRRPSRDRM